jgi:nucleoside-diphosphate-sugar epimerase
MRVLVVRASGAIGRRLVPQLIEAGHDVVGTCRSLENEGTLRAEGAEAVVLDALDPHAVRETVTRVEPDAIVHQATALADADLRSSTRPPHRIGRRPGGVTPRPEGRRRDPGDPRATHRPAPPDGRRGR